MNRQYWHSVVWALSLIRFKQKLERLKLKYNEDINKEGLAVASIVRDVVVED